MPHHNLRNQSAMEYLMTYGWAIIIVAIVLGALFQLGFFNGTSVIPQGCIAQSGYYCSNPVLSTTGVLTLTVGQATGTQMNNTILYFVPSGSSLSHAASVNTGTLSMGQTTTVSMPLPTGSPFPSSYALGTQISGTLYLGYVQSGQVLNSRFGTISIKVTGASGAVLQQQPNSTPSGISTYVQITLSNSQSSATPAPFQQMVQFQESTYSNYITYNGNAANFEFFDQNGQVIPSWIESNSSGMITVWLKLPNGITASNSIEVYLGFAPKSTNLLSSSGTTGIGEAPQLSSTYAQYDDGASVFPNYWNFAGTSLPSGWTGINYTINNGINIPYPSYAETTATYGPSSSTILDFYGNLPSSTLASQSAYGFINGSTDYCTQVAWTQLDWGYGSNSGFFISTMYPMTIANGGRTCINTPTISGYNVYTIYFPSSSSSSFSYNYGTTGTITTNPSSSLSIGFINKQGNNYIGGPFYWVRVRAYPPSGVMPSVSFGGVS